MGGQGQQAAWKPSEERSGRRGAAVDAEQPGTRGCLERIQLDVNRGGLRKDLFLGRKTPIFTQLGRGNSRAVSDGIQSLIYPWSSGAWLGRADPRGRLGSPPCRGGPRAAPSWEPRHPLPAIPSQFEGQLQRPPLIVEVIPRPGIVLGPIFVIYNKSDAPGSADITHSLLSSSLVAVKLPENRL